MSSIKIPFDEYRHRVLGCWLGKAVGGTLGGPWEGVPLDHEVTYYDPVPDEMLPNDDLDLQVVWLQAVRERGLPIDRRLLASAWRDNVHLWPGEYGMCRVNLERGLFPPLTGLLDNGQFAGMGAAIRTELWACLAPGAPELAAHFAREDACADHTTTGIDAAVFLAAVESAAFVEGGREKLLDLGLDHLPAGSEIGAAVQLVRREWDRTPDRKTVLDRLLDAHHSQDFTFTPVNLGITVLGWLAGGGAFGRSISAAVSCGQDTDCTGATLGSILGLLDPDSIEPEWLDPIGRDLVLSPGMTGMAPADDLDGLTDQVADLAPQVLDYYGAAVELTGAPGPRRRVRHRVPAALVKTVRRRTLDPTTSLVANDPLGVTVRYPESVRVAPGETATVEVAVQNLADAPTAAPVRLHGPDGWTVETDDAATGGPLAPGGVAAVSARVTPEEPRWRPYWSRLGVEVGEGAARREHVAGLLMTIPFAVWPVEGWPDAVPERPQDAALYEAPSHYVDLGALPVAHPGGGGAVVLQTHIKLPFHMSPRFVTQSLGRPTQTWLDDRRIHEQPGHYANAAVHLAEHTGVDLTLRRGGYVLTVVVGPSIGAEGLLTAGPLAHETRSLLNPARARVLTEREGDRLYLAVGYGDLWRWVEDLEFQNPLVWPSPSGKAQPTFGVAEPVPA